MDLLTHILLTGKLIDKRPATLAAAIGPDAPFYLTYPAWVIAQGEAGHALSTGQWPDPPPWMEALHHAFHSLPVALTGAALIRLASGQWPDQALKAWVLHILVDIPTHARATWGPRFLWPFSDVAVDGFSWADAASGLIVAALNKRRSRG